MNATRLCLALAVLLIPGERIAHAEEYQFDDPLFRRCISWMLDGTRGALIENLCKDDFSIPPPSIFACARKVMTGFKSDSDREGCALIFEEQAKRARAGRLVQ